MTKAEKSNLLVNILSDQMEHYRLLYKLLKREKACLLYLDMDNVIEMTKEKDTLLLKLRLLEKEKKKLISQCPHDDIAVSKIWDSSSKLNSLIQDIKQLSTANSLLVRRSLDYINNIFHFLNRMGIDFNVKDSGTFLTKQV
jgi:flagellar biosynthesis/type III secretory pathway chaperone